MPEYFQQVARARQQGFDAIADSVFEIADNDERDWEQITDQEGNVTGIKVNGEHVQRSKLRIDARLQLLAKWDPKRYGDKQLHVGGDGESPIQVEFYIPANGRESQ